MSDPPLHTLCPTCHLHPPLYTCPRCSLRSCSLTCVLTHKRRADCTGVRDPTLYKPMRELATPAGVDHDYNFLSKIERGVERSDKVIVEGGLVAGGEVRGGPGFGQERRGRGGREMGMGEAEKKVGREIEGRGVRWERLPAGMGRRKANGTSWSRKRGCLVWQVEWVAPVTATPTTITSTASINTNNTFTTAATVATPSPVPGMLGPLSKILSTTPLNEAYTAFIEEARRATLTPEEKAGEKRRRAAEVAERGGKRVKTSPEAGAGSPVPEPQPQLQPDTSEASMTAGGEVVQQDTGTEEAGKGDEKPKPPPKNEEYKFYLHRPLTLASGPTVLIPLRGDEGLDAQLSGKVVLEFPRVYVFPASMAIPGGFEVEGGEGGDGGDGGGEEGEGEGGGKEGVEDSDTSSSGSSSEEEEESEEEGEGEEDASPSAEGVVEGGDGGGDGGVEVSLADRTGVKPEMGDVVAS
ncbi:hypothetical protein VE03_10139 [Pseudogymnoascus sp. 23342-1-I1]|nr:hypothetical protein VE03_10139 [Pseudogymnoascus sp. 23342-1-I1]